MQGMVGLCKNACFFVFFSMDEFRRAMDVVNGELREFHHSIL
jgi:hypothetical protein